MLAVVVLSGLAFGKDNSDDEDDAAKPKPALPNLYLDLRTIYSTVPAGALSFGFSAPPLLATLSALTALPTLTAPSSRNISIDLPLTVDVNDRLSVYGGVSGGSTQSGTSPWTSFDIYALRSDFRPTSISRTADCFRR